MKKTLTASFTCILFFNYIQTSAPSFRQTQEEECAEVAQHMSVRPGPRTEESFKETKEVIALGIRRRLPHCMPLQEASEIPESLCTDLIATFAVLQQLMQIPSDVQLLFNRRLNPEGQPSTLHGKAPMIYDWGSRTIYIFPELIKYPPTTILSNLIHESKHVKQHQESGLWHRFQNQGIAGFKQQQENKADLCAVTATNCTTCLQIMQSGRHFLPGDPAFNKDNGYMTAEDIEDKVRSAQPCDICQAHQETAYNTPEFLNLLLQARTTTDLSERSRLKNAIKEADLAMPSMLLRMSTVRFQKDLPNQ